MKILKYPEIKSLQCKVCGAEFEVNKRDLRKGILSCSYSHPSVMGVGSSITEEPELSCTCPVCGNKENLDCFSEKALSETVMNIKHKIEEIFFNSSEEVRENKDLYSKETAILLNNLYTDVENYLDSLLGVEELEEDDDQ